MELTREIIEEVALAAQGIEHGKVTVSITTEPTRKVIDIITEKRTRFYQSIPTRPEGRGSPKDRY